MSHSKHIYFGPEVGADHGPSESAALTVGAEGTQFQAKAWKEILDVLEQQSPEIREIVQA